MGCDIHLYVEYKQKDYERWNSFGGRINPGRIYGLFSRLAGVRGYEDVKPIAADRGMPSDAAYYAENDNRLYISESEGEDYVKPDTAAKWVNDGSSVYTDERMCFVTHPDWHSHSWATTKEFEDAINQTFCKDGSYIGDFIEYAAVLSVMKEFEKHDAISRIIFWFDN